jgi:hypothetical protein
VRRVVLVEGRFLTARLVVEEDSLLLGEPRVLAAEGGWDFHLQLCLPVAAVVVAVEVLSVVVEVVFGVEAVLEEVVMQVVVVVVVLHREVEVEVVVEAR